MFRILVISLFVANLLLFGFQRSNPEVREEVPVAPVVKKNSGIPTIHLFGEMIQDEDLLTGNRQCFSLGPFHSSEDKDEVRLLLQEVSTHISERQTEALVEKGYWVFMPPYGSLLEANQALISLQAQGLEDIGVVYDGDWKNAISLGYFMRQENAQRRKKSVESKGYAPMIRVQRQGEPRYWLDFEQPPGSALIAMDMQNRPNDFMQRSLPCPEEDTAEFAETDLLEPVEVVAQLQVPEDDNEPALDRSEDQDTEAAVVNVPQEQLETSPIQAVETTPEVVIGTGSGDAIEAESEDATGTVQQGSVDTEPEDTDGIGQQENTGTEAEDAAVTGQEDVIDTQPRNSVGTGPQDAIDTEPAGAVETGLDDALETGQEPADVSVPDDTGETGAGEG